MGKKKEDLEKNKNGPNLKEMLLACLVTCTKQEQIYSANWQSVLFVQKSMILDDGSMYGWMDGWVGGNAGLRIAYTNQKY